MSIDNVIIVYHSFRGVEHFQNVYIILRSNSCLCIFDLFIGIAIGDEIIKMARLGSYKPV